jgi:hypothetical protein
MASEQYPLDVSVQLETDEKKRIAVLRQQMRDTAKEIKQLQSITQRDEDMARWKMISDLKQKFVKELKSHPDLKRMSWNNFANYGDYFIYALSKGQYTHYAIDDTAEWIQKARKQGKTLLELEDNAKRMRHARYDRARRAERAAKKKKQDEINKLNAANIKAEKEKEKAKKERIGEPSKASLQNHLGNG